MYVENIKEYHTENVGSNHSQQKYYIDCCLYVILHIIKSIDLIWYSVQGKVLVPVSDEETLHRVNTPTLLLSSHIALVH